MNVAVLYVLPIISPKLYEPMAARFVQKYIEHPTAINHNLYVCLNGASWVTAEQERLFHPLSPTFVFHNNSGKDVGAYQMVAQSAPCDLLVCMGTPTRPCEDGWLDYMVQAVEDNGPGVYGCWAFTVPRPHIRTTLFWCQPEILNAYPRVQNENRYEFEFGSQSIAQWSLNNGMAALQVTRRGVFASNDWGHVDRQDCICLDQHCDNLNYKD
jgi:hypothetical protein